MLPVGLQSTKEEPISPDRYFEKACYWKSIHFGSYRKSHAYRWLNYFLQYNKRIIYNKRLKDTNIFSHHHYILSFCLYFSDLCFC